MRKLPDGGRNENGAGDLHGAGLMVLGNDVYHGCDLPPRGAVLCILLRS